MIKNRIEICGGIATGKTSLANILEKNGFGLGVYEEFSKNPFWKEFYKNQGKYIFETEITFTLQHYHDIKKQIINNDLLICDYSLVLDYAYANIGLKDKKLEIYKNILNEIYVDISIPKLIIYLKCSSQEELARIKLRGREVEKEISIDFLESLNNSINNSIEQRKEKILIIDSEKYNFVTNEKDKEIILSLIKGYLK